MVPKNTKFYQQKLVYQLKPQIRIQKPTQICSQNPLTHILFLASETCSNKIQYKYNIHISKS